MASPPHPSLSSTAQKTRNARDDASRGTFGMAGQQLAIGLEEADLDDGRRGRPRDFAERMITAHVVGDRIGMARQAGRVAVGAPEAIGQPTGFAVGGRLMRRQAGDFIAAELDGARMDTKASAR